MQRVFSDSGYDSRLLVRYDPEGRNGRIISYYRKKPSRLLGKLEIKLRRILSGDLGKSIPSYPKYYFYLRHDSTRYISTRKLLSKAGFTPDVIIVYFYQQFLNSRNIHELHKLTGAPILLLMMDMAPLTGGCHYAWDCRKYESDCSSCPALKSSFNKNLAYRNLKRKGKFFSKTNLNLITASEWQYKQAGRSYLFSGKEVYKVLTSFDPLIFKPADKSVLKKKYGIPAGAKVIFWGAGHLKDPRKGFNEFLDSIDILAKTYEENENIFIYIAGEADDATRNKVLPFRSRFAGKLSLEEIIEAYQMSHLYACSSVEDSGPTMINQAIICGTPVVSFEMGISLDLVHNGITGFRIKMGDSVEFAGGMNKILELGKEEYENLSKRCREEGLRKCNPENQLELYREIFRSMNLQP